MHHREHEFNAALALAQSLRAVIEVHPGDWSRDVAALTRLIAKLENGNRVQACKALADRAFSILLRS